MSLAYKSNPRILGIKVRGESSKVQTAFAIAWAKHKVFTLNKTQRAKRTSLADAGIDMPGGIRQYHFRLTLWRNVAITLKRDRLLRWQIDIDFPPGAIRTICYNVDAAVRYDEDSFQSFFNLETGNLSELQAATAINIRTVTDPAQENVVGVNATALGNRLDVTLRLRDDVTPYNRRTFEQKCLDAGVTEAFVNSQREIEDPEVGAMNKWVFLNAPPAWVSAGTFDFAVFQVAPAYIDTVNQKVTLFLITDDIHAEGYGATLADQIVSPHAESLGVEQHRQLPFIVVTVPLASYLVNDNLTVTESFSDVPAGTALTVTWNNFVINIGTTPTDEGTFDEDNFEFTAIPDGDILAVTTLVGNNVDGVAGTVSASVIIYVQSGTAPEYRRGIDLTGVLPEDVKAVDLRPFFVGGNILNDYLSLRGTAIGAVNGKYEGFSTAEDTVEVQDRRDTTPTVIEGGLYTHLAEVVAEQPWQGVAGAEDLVRGPPFGARDSANAAAGGLPAIKVWSYVRFNPQHYLEIRVRETLTHVGTLTGTDGNGGVLRFNTYTESFEESVSWKRFTFLDGEIGTVVDVIPNSNDEAFYMLSQHPADVISKGITYDIDVPGGSLAATERDVRKTGETFTLGAQSKTAKLFTGLIADAPLNTLQGNTSALFTELTNGGTEESQNKTAVVDSVTGLVYVSTGSGVVRLDSVWKDGVKIWDTSLIAPSEMSMINRPADALINTSNHEHALALTWPLGLNLAFAKSFLYTSNAFNKSLFETNYGRVEHVQNAAAVLSGRSGAANNTPDIDVFELPPTQNSTVFGSLTGILSVFWPDAGGDGVHGVFSAAYTDAYRTLIFEYLALIVDDPDQENAATIAKRQETIDEISVIYNNFASEDFMLAVSVNFNGPVFILK